MSKWQVCLVENVTSTAFDLSKSDARRVQVSAISLILAESPVSSIERATSGMLAMRKYPYFFASPISGEVAEYWGIEIMIVESLLTLSS